MAKLQTQIDGGERMADPKPRFDWRAPPDGLWRAAIFLLALGVLLLSTTRWNRWETNDSADLHPRITLKALYNCITSELSEFSGHNACTWGLGPSSYWTFANEAGPRARVRQAKPNTAAALASFDAVVLQSLKETEQALTVYRSELDRRQARSEA